MARIIAENRTRGLGAPRTARGAVLAVAIAALVAAGCARPGPPGGGPADTTPPDVASTIPGAGEAGVDRTSRVEIEFSEEMNRQTTERSLSIRPPVEFRNLRWKGTTLIAVPEAGLPDSTTFAVRIAESAQDYHGVSMAAPFVFLFSTGDIIDTGVISGVVTSNGAPSSGAIVWACRSPGDPNDEGRLEACGYVAATDQNGLFRMENVRASVGPYVLLAFLDSDGDGMYSLGDEPGTISSAAALIEAVGDSAVGIEITIEGPTRGETPEADGEER